MSVTFEEIEGSPAAITHRRKVLGLTIEELAREAGIPAKALSDHEALTDGGNIQIYAKATGALDRLEAAKKKA